jgi:8-oxo-dGTP pyrophosphatase MutT (NUDIX family)
VSFQRHIRACNNLDRSDFIPFHIDGMVVGLVRPRFAQKLRQWPDVFRVEDDVLELVTAERDLMGRSRAVAEVLSQLVDQGVISHLHGEQYVATPGGREDGLLLIDRTAAPYFGIRAFGQHVNGYVREGDSLKIWVARRSMDRKNYPGMLDNIVAGGLPYGITLEQNLQKECWEEASIPTDLVDLAEMTGVVTYNAETPEGYKPDTLFCYDLELPGDFVPSCVDGEVEQFYLWPVEKVMEKVEYSNEYKLNCNLVVIDFLIRHGYLGQEHAGLAVNLHPELSLQSEPMDMGSI